VLLAALVGAAVMGVVGALVAIPVAAALKVVLVQQIDHYEAQAAATSARRHPHLPRLRRRADPAQPPPPDGVPAQGGVAAQGGVPASGGIPASGGVPAQGGVPSPGAAAPSDAAPPHA
jgi:hypothetical protein